MILLSPLESKQQQQISSVNAVWAYNLRRKGSKEIDLGNGEEC
jgi:hypothetical protein